MKGSCGRLSCSVGLRVELIDEFVMKQGCDAGL